MTRIKNFLRTNFLALWLPVVVYSGLIGYLSHQINPPNPFAWKVPDKLIHFTEFFLLGTLLARALIWQRYFRHIQRFWYVIGILFLVLFAAADEWHQSFIPGREVEVLDWWADFLGGLTGMGVGWFFCRWQIRHLKSEGKESTSQWS